MSSLGISSTMDKSSCSQLVLPQKQTTHTWFHQGVLARWQHNSNRFHSPNIRTRGELAHHFFVLFFRRSWIRRCYNLLLHCCSYIRMITGMHAASITSKWHALFPQLLHWSKYLARVWQASNISMFSPHQWPIILNTLLRFYYQDTRQSNTVCWCMFNVLISVLTFTDLLIMKLIKFRLACQLSTCVELVFFGDPVRMFVHTMLFKGKIVLKVQ